MFEQNFSRLLPAAEALLLDLIARRGGGPLLIVSGDPISDAFDTLGAVKVSLSSDSEHLATCADAILAGGPYAGALIIPPFGTQVPVESARLPPTWSAQRWFAEEYLIAHASSRLLPGAWLAAFVSTGLLSVNVRKDARRDLVAHGLRLVATLPNETLWQPAHNVDTPLVLLAHEQDAGTPLAMLDLSAASDLPPSAAFSAWREGKQYPDIHTPQPVFVARGNLGEDIRLDPAYHDPKYLELRAPAGFDEHLLGDIGEFISGIRMPASNRLSERPGSGGIPYVQVRHLRPDGTLDEQPYWLDMDVAAPHMIKRAMPGDILVSTSGTIGKVALIGPNHPEGVLFDTSIRRVRIRKKEISPQDIAEYLRSEIGQMQFRRLTIGSVIPHLASKQLAQIRVFLPSSAPSAQTKATGPEPTESAPLTQTLAQIIEGELLAILEQVRSGEGIDWQQPVAEKLRRIAMDIDPPPLAERVRREFPAPLAIAYRRYYMAQHNPYEQLDRMINLVEACTYFAFHVLLADYSRADWKAKIQLSKDARKALKTHATFDSRIRFIRELNACARESHLDLFVPGLADCGIERYIDEFRQDLRNPVAHSAPGSEAYVLRLVQQHEKKLHELLGQIAFFADYRMCRIRSHYFRHGRWYYQCELYQGEEYDTNLREMELGDTEQNGRLIAADRDHLVLLSPELEALDLWPYYQLHYSEVTCRESHLCFVKHLSDRKLHGESVRSGIELELEGFDDYYRAATAAT